MSADRDDCLPASVTTEDGDELLVCRDCGGGTPLLIGDRCVKCDADPYKFQPRCANCNRRIQQVLSPGLRSRWEHIAGRSVNCWPPLRATPKAAS